MLKTCARDGCGTPFEARSSRWRFCSEVCQKQQQYRDHYALPDVPPFEHAERSHIFDEPAPYCRGCGLRTWHWPGCRNA